MSNQDTRVMLIAPDGNSVFKESGSGAYARTLKALWVYAEQGLLHQDTKSQIISDFPAFEEVMSHRLAKSRYYRLTPNSSRVPEEDRKKPRAWHQVFIIPSRTAMMLFRNREDVRDELSEFNPGQPCLIIVDDWSRAKSKRAGHSAKSKVIPTPPSSSSESEHISNEDQEKGRLYESQ